MGLQYRPKTLDGLSYHEGLTARLRALVSNASLRQDSLWFYLTDLELWTLDRRTRAISPIYSCTGHQEQARKPE